MMFQPSTMILHLRTLQSVTLTAIGANRGIGFNLARTLAAQNWAVIGSVRPDTMRAEDPSIKEVFLPSHTASWY